MEPTGELHLVGHVSASGSPSLPACSRISVSQCQNVGAFHRGIAVGVVPPRGAQCLGLPLGVGSTSHPLAATRQDAGMGLGLTGGCRQGAGLGLGLSFGSHWCQQAGCWCGFGSTVGLKAVTRRAAGLNCGEKWSCWFIRL